MSHRRPGAGTVRHLPSGRWQARRTEADGALRSLGTWLTRAEAERAFAGAFTYALRRGVIAGNPARQVRKPSRRRRKLVILTPGDVARLADEISHPNFATAGNGASLAVPLERPEYGLAVRVAAYTGLRAGELWALRAGRVVLDADPPALVVAESVTDVDGRLVWGATKTGRNRRVPIPPALVGQLASHIDGLGDDDLVWPAPQGGPIRHALFYRRHCSPKRDRAGLAGLRWHDLRHSYAALLISTGAHPRAVMERMGHSSITVTLGTYGHLFPAVDAALTTALDAAILAADPNLSGTTLARQNAAPHTHPV